jgi:hypothetical protein
MSYYSVEVNGDVIHVTKSLNKSRLKRWIYNWIEDNLYTDDMVIYINKVKLDDHLYNLYVSSKLKNVLWGIEKDLCTINVSKIRYVNTTD